MAPRKPTTKASTEGDPGELILSYLVAQNRPYSATEISSNLHNKVTKTRTDKVLKELHEKGEIAGHTSGKSTVYWCLQVCQIILVKIL
jgi:26S proteasome regulatory subunit (ATPase 3-interacting protein)